MASSPIRVVILLGALALLALTGATSAASAAEMISGSQITSPSDPAYVLANEGSDLSTTILFTVTGTVTGASSGEVDVRCYYGSAVGDYSDLAERVPVLDGAFSLAVTSGMLQYERPCVLRAVPPENEEPHPPGSPDAFAGPRLAASYVEGYSGPAGQNGYWFDANSLSAKFVIESVGDCGLAHSELFAAPLLSESEPLFVCDAALDESNYPETRSEVQIDDANAYSPAAAGYLVSKLKATVKDAPQVSVTESFESGLTQIHELDPMVECYPQSSYPPTTSSCTKFVSTGVELERTWQTTDANQIAWMTDTWRSTDGAAHSLNALYDESLAVAKTSVVPRAWSGAYEFPGTDAFSPATKGQAVSPPDSSGAILYEQDALTPATGDGEHPLGAIVYDSAPSEPLQIYEGSNESDYTEFDMPYQRTIPAGGSTTLRMTFAQAYSLSEVQDLTKEVLTSYFPSLAISAPANGTTVTTPEITVSGNASDSGQLSSVTVNGNPVAPEESGAWATDVTLSPGVNTITAVATDEAGLSTPASVNVTYDEPSTPPPPEQTVGDLTLTPEHRSTGHANGPLSFTISCANTSKTGCEIRSSLTSVERRRGGKLIAISARPHPRTTLSKRVTVASSQIAIPAGQSATVMLKLNLTGRRLLAKFGRLPAHLNVILMGTAATIISQDVTIGPAARKHRGRARHRGR